MNNYWLQVAECRKIAKELQKKYHGKSSNEVYPFIIEDFRSLVTIFGPTGYFKLNYHWSDNLNIKTSCSFLSVFGQHVHEKNENLTSEFTLLWIQLGPRSAQNFENGRAYPILVPY